MNFRITGNNLIDALLVLFVILVLGTIIWMAIKAFFSALKKILINAIAWTIAYSSERPHIAILVLGVVFSLIAAFQRGIIDGLKLLGGFTLLSAIVLGIKKIWMSISNAGVVKKLSNGSSNASAEDMGIYTSRKPEVTFADVAGMDKLKVELMDMVNDHRAAKKNGVLLSGEPGNGKTLIAEALAGQLKWNFMPIRIGEIQSHWIGETTERLNAAFAAAKRQTKLILFLDECDSMLVNREVLMNDTVNPAASKDAKNTVDTFITNIIDIRKCKDVIVIAATNFPDNLDSAAIRDGRFDFKIHIPNPDAAARRGLLEKFSQEKGWKVEFEQSVMERLVRRWEGFSVVRIKSIGEKILKNSKASGRKEVTLDDAFKALRQIQGSLGDEISENTPTLKDGGLQFDAEMSSKLMTLANRLENIDEFERMGGSIPKGAVFWGKAGTGKTATAKSLAKTSGWAFLGTTGSNMLSDNGGGFEKLIKKANDLRPCIVFIDEAEQALANRELINSEGIRLVVNRFLAVTDGTRTLRDVFFIAATNHFNQLDPAVLRGGRLSEHFEFKAPEEDTVLKIVVEWLSEKRGIAPFHESFTAEAASRLLTGKAPADIKEKLQQAVNNGLGRIMAGEGERFITISDLETAM